MLVGCAACLYALLACKTRYSDVSLYLRRCETIHRIPDTIIHCSAGRENYHGKLIGGVGVSRGTVNQDVEVATAALAGVGASASAPT